MKDYKIYRIIKGVLKHVRTVQATSAWYVKLNLGECVFGIFN